MHRQLTIIGEEVDFVEMSKTRPQSAQSAWRTSYNTAFGSSSNSRPMSKSNSVSHITSKHLQPTTSSSSRVRDGSSSNNRQRPSSAAVSTRTPHQRTLARVQSAGQFRREENFSRDPSSMSRSMQSMHSASTSNLPMLTEEELAWSQQYNFQEARMTRSRFVRPYSAAAVMRANNTEVYQEQPSPRREETDEPEESVLELLRYGGVQDFVPPPRQDPFYNAKKQLQHDQQTLQINSFPQRKMKKKRTPTRPARRGAKWSEMTVGQCINPEARMVTDHTAAVKIGYAKDLGDFRTTDSCPVSDLMTDSFTGMNVTSKSIISHTRDPIFVKRPGPKKEKAPRHMYETSYQAGQGAHTQEAQIRDRAAKRKIAREMAQMTAEEAWNPHPVLFNPTPAHTEGANAGYK